jgi:Flp pilus assembly protein TadG
MLRKFLRDIRGSYAIATAVAMAPIMGGLALAIDFTEMNRQRQATIHALDAANLATSWRFDKGASDEELKAYAKDYFEANLGPVDPKDTVLHVALPSSGGGGTLRMTADLTYRPYFYPAFLAMMSDGGSSRIKFRATSEVRLKNTLEVALALDNSGSMKELGKGSNKVRFDLLKEAAKQLVDTIAAEGQLIKQVDKPVQFALVPFAASVNVGPDNAGQPWMDQDGISPIHHENFDWSTFSSSSKKVEKAGGVYYKKGNGWGSAEGEKVTRFTLFKELKRLVCDDWDDDECEDWDEPSSFASWEGCVEARPSPYNTTDAAPSSAIPATLFVPMFAPDETDRTDSYSRPANNNWWKDGTSESSSSYRQRYMPKYFTPAPLEDDGDSVDRMGLNEGPNASCTTKPITPLVDVSTSAGLTKIKGAIDNMIALGGTNVPEGLAWGWRAVSGGSPFTEGRSDQERGNDKVVILLTDGENTYYTPTSVVAYRYSGQYWNYGGNDLAGSKSIYSSFGYPKPYSNGYSHGRLFLGTSSGIGKTDFSNSNYGAALNEHMATVCSNAKASNVIVMTVALDLDPANNAQKKQIDGLRACASESRFRKDPDDPSKPAKLFWNATGGNLADKFKEIADELSNLRIVG